MKKLKAQQIMEFMIAAPILILFFVILTEFALAFHSYIFFTNAINSSFSAYLDSISTDNKEENYNDSIKNHIEKEFNKYKLLNIEELNTELITVENFPAVVGSYTYKPSLKYTLLPALKNIKMQTITIFPFTINDLSGYKNAITTEELNLIQPENPLEF